MVPLRVILLLIAAGAMRGAEAHAQLATPSSDCVAVAGPELVTPTDSAQRSAARTTTPDTVHAAVRLFASVQASEVTFAREPKICVRLNGDARLDSLHVVGRRNITSPVVAGTTYRDVYVAVEILGHLNAECIAARITGSASGAATNERCASLSIRDSTAAKRAGASPP